MSPEKILKTIKAHTNFLVVTHVNPDPDALCSQLAMGVFLKSLGKEVSMLGEEAPPKRFSFFPGIKQVKPYQAIHKGKYDCVVIVDCGDFDRIGKLKSILTNQPVIINIDHHITNDKFGDVNLVDVKASSTAEVLYEFFKRAKFKITKNVAICLYLGIMTDTGSFRYDNTTARTHTIAGELRKFDFNAYAFYQKIYEAIPLKDIEGFVKVISQFKFCFQKRVAYVCLRKATMKCFSQSFDLRDAIFKFLGSVHDLEVIVIFTEQSSYDTRANFRSSSQFNVAKLAHYFNGGGHKKASGCAVPKSLKQTQKAVLRKIKEML